MRLLDIETEKKKLTLTHLDWKLSDAQKRGYPHFTIKEIMDQVLTVPKTALLSKPEMESIALQVKKRSRIILIGCGTAAYCALMSQYFFAQVGLEAKSYGAYEFLPFSGFSDEKDGYFCYFSKRRDRRYPYRRAGGQENGAWLVAVINSRGSTLETLADVVLPVGAGPEIAVVSTKAFTSQLATMYLVSRMCAGNYEAAVNEVKVLGALLKKWQTKKLCGEVLDLAKFLMRQEDMYVIGKHMSYPAALEFALKIKEASYIHSEPFAAGNSNMASLRSSRKARRALPSAAMTRRNLNYSRARHSLKTRGGMIIGVAPYASPEFEVHIATPDAGPLTIIPNVIVGQLLGYYLGVGRGTDPTNREFG